MTKFSSFMPRENMVRLPPAGERVEISSLDGWTFDAFRTANLVF